LVKKEKISIEEQIERLRVPRKGELLGVVDQLVGFDRIRVRCKDGYVRICRIPGKLRKRLWIREGDLVIVRPWEVQGEEKGDVVYRYTNTQVEWLQRKGIWS
jgi:translation initiation factor 1A